MIVMSCLAFESVPAAAPTRRSKITLRVLRRAGSPAAPCSAPGEHVGVRADGARGRALSRCSSLCLAGTRSDRPRPLEDQAWLRHSANRDGECGVGALC